MEDRVKRLLRKMLGVEISTTVVAKHHFTQFHFIDEKQTILFDPISHAAALVEPDSDGDAICRAWLDRKKAFVDDPYSVDLIRSIEYYATSACNLACTYCYLGSLPSKVSLQDQNPDPAIEAISQYFHEGRIGPELDLLLIGGEPLLARVGIEKVVKCVKELAHRYKVKLSLLVTTNGSVLSERYLGWLASNSFKVTISLDGPFQEQNRPTKSGAQRAVPLNEAIAALSPDRVVIKTTLTSGQLAFQTEAFESMRAVGATKIYVNASHGSIAVSDNDIADNIRGIVHLAQHCEAVGNFEGHLAEAAYVMRHGILASSHCSAGVSHIVLDSRGRKSGCANVREDGRFEARYPGAYHVDTDPVCGNCSLRYVCNAVGGGCRAWRVLSETVAPDPLECSASASRFILALRGLALSHDTSSNIAANASVAAQKDGAEADSSGFRAAELRR